MQMGKMRYGFKCPNPGLLSFLPGLKRLWEQSNNLHFLRAGLVACEVAEEPLPDWLSTALINKLGNLADGRHQRSDTKKIEDLTREEFVFHLVSIIRRAQGMKLNDTSYDSMSSKDAEQQLSEIAESDGVELGSGELGAQFAAEEIYNRIYEKGRGGDRIDKIYDQMRVHRCGDFGDHALGFVRICLNQFAFDECYSQ